MIPQHVVAWARQAQRRAGVTDLAAALALSVVGPESSYNPHAIGDAGASFGLMQFYTQGGLGDGHAPSDLLDPIYNLQLGMSYIQSRLDAGASPYDALGPWTTRDQAMAGLQSAMDVLESGISREIAGGADGSAVLPLAVVAVLAILLLS